MTDKEINQYIHEKILGHCWHVQCPKMHKDVMGGPWYVCSKCKRKFVTTRFWSRPDYCSDLNLIAQVEAFLKEAGCSQLYARYIHRELSLTNSLNGYAFVFQQITLPAKIRAEYLVRTWENWTKVSMEINSKGCQLTG